MNHPVNKKKLAGFVIGFLLLLSLVWPVPRGIIEAESTRTTTVWGSNGATLREFQSDGRGEPIHLEQLPPFIAQALVATEDRRFFKHVGVDPFALLESARLNLQHGEIRRGGSTITMQVARSIRQSRTRGFIDKLLESHLAVRLEMYFSKEELLGLWLSRVSFGNQTFGLEAASEFYYSKSARDLTLDEAALLIGLPQRPSHLNPLRYPDHALARRQVVLNSMLESGFLDNTTHSRASLLPARLNPSQAEFLAPHLAERLVSQDFASARPLQGVQSTINKRLQRAVEGYAREHVEALGDLGVGNISAIVIDNLTGEVLAYLGSADYWNQESEGMNDGVTMLRQPGSTLKPFLYGYAIQHDGFSTATILQDTPLQIVGISGAFSPENYDKKYHGPVSVRRALACSYNVPAVRVAQEIGVGNFWHALRNVGFESLTRSPDKYGVGLALGNGEVRLQDLARAYTALARGGTSVDPVFYKNYVTTSGDTVHAPQATIRKTWITPETAFAITDILADAEARAPAFGRGGPLELPFPVAVKTGTSKDYRDNWAVGYTPLHTVAVWAGNFDGSPMRQVSGVAGAGQLLHAIFLELGTGGRFIAPAGVEYRHVCSDSGLKPHSFCPTVERRPFARKSPEQSVCNTHRRLAGPYKKNPLVERVTPKEFQAWLRDAGASVVYSDSTLSVRIDQPTSGSRYYIDPVLRPEFQQARLRATVTSTPDSIAWFKDGTRLHGMDLDGFWTLESGSHKFTLVGYKDGIRYDSEPVLIHVHSAQQEPLSVSP